METIVVNLFGAPGSGKSTGAAYVFAKLKMNGVNAELVTEFAKDKVWEENKAAFANQVYLFGNQSYRMSRCADKVDVIVTDSPLPLSVLYNCYPNSMESFNESVMDVFNSYNNINFLICRTKPYNPIGRHQTERESDALHYELKQMMHEEHIQYVEVSGDETGYDYIISTVLEKLKPKNDKQKQKDEQEHKVISPELAIKYSAIMCEEINHCNDCPLHGLGDCDYNKMNNPQIVVEAVTKWAIENGYITEDFEEIQK